MFFRGGMKEGGTARKAGLPCPWVHPALFRLSCLLQGGLFPLSTVLRCFFHVSVLAAAVVFAECEAGLV